MDQMDNQGSA